MSREDTQASPFAALFDWERKNGGGGGGKPKVKVSGGGSRISEAKLRASGNKRVRRFNAGHHLAGTKINNVVKVKFVRNNHDAARHVIQHIDYIQNRERDKDEPERKFYGRDGERSRHEVIDAVMRNRGKDAAMFKIILSPKQNELNHIEYATEIMRRFEDRTGIKTDWSMVEHRNTQYHHVHIVMPGRDMDGRSYRLDQEHLDIFREIANEHQYELQYLDYQKEKEIEQEFGFSRDEAEMILTSQRDLREMKDLGVYKPSVDKLVREDLLPPTDFDHLSLALKYEREFWTKASQDFKDLNVEANNWLREEHPELFGGLIKRMQAERINNAYFARLKEFHPAEYYRYQHDPTLDRMPVVNKLKQVFPEWFDGIVDKLKEQDPKLFENYEKPGLTDRQLMDNLRETKPELFPELSKQVQERQLNTVMLAMLATVNPSRLEQIVEEGDERRQGELLDKARSDYPEIVQQARERLSERFPDLYQWGKKSPSNQELIAQLVKEQPLLFPEATQELRRLEIDRALIERLREENPKLAREVELDPELMGVATTAIRWFYPAEVEKATSLVREQQPELFRYERNEPSEAAIMKALEEKQPDLFPQILQKLREDEIDKAYFERGTTSTPDGLRAYIDNPELDRSELYRVLRSKHPEWREAIEQGLKQSRPELFKFARSHQTDNERLAELRESAPHLFPGMKAAERGGQGQVLDQLEEQSQALEVEPTSRLEKLEQIKERLIDKEIFEKGREQMPDKLVLYLENAHYDRQYITEGLRLAHPEWVQEAEGKLREMHPLFFEAIEHESGLVERELQERRAELEQLSAEHTGAQFAEEAKLLMQITKASPDRAIDERSPLKEAPAQRQEHDQGSVLQRENTRDADGPGDKRDAQKSVQEHSLPAADWPAIEKGAPEKDFSSNSEEFEKGKDLGSGRRAQEESERQHQGRLNEHRQLDDRQVNDRQIEDRPDKDWQSADWQSEKHQSADRQAGDGQEDSATELMDKADDVMLEAENLLTGREWVGLTAFVDPGFVAEPLDLSKEAEALFESQQAISKELNESEADVTLIAPYLFKLEETLDDVKQDLDAIDKDDSERNL